MAIYQSGNPQFQGLLYQNLIHYDNTNEILLDLDRMWTQTWNFVNQLTNNKSVGFNSVDGTYNRMIARRISISAPIGVQGAQSGQNLVLTFQDGTYSGFRVKDQVFDSAMNEGRVILSTPGSITIEPLFNPTALVAGTHFLAGTIVYWAGDISGNFNSSDKTNLYRTNDIQTDYSAVYRDSAQTARREEVLTWSGMKGEFYSYSMAEKEMLKRCFKQDAIKFLIGTEGTKFSQVEGQINKSRSMRAAIMADGTYINTGAPLDVNTWNDMLNQVANYTGKFTQELTIIPGRAAAAIISTFYNSQLNFTGSTVKFGERPVVNLDIREITIAGGITARLMPLEMLNDSLTLPSWFTNSVFIIDTTAIPSFMGVGSEPPIQRIHFTKGIATGSVRETEETQIYYAVPGTIGPNGKFMGTGEGGYEMTSNPIDGYQVGWLRDSGYSMIADNWALFEYQIGT